MLLNKGQAIKPQLQDGNSADCEHPFLSEKENSTSEGENLIDSIHNPTKSQQENVTGSTMDSNTVGNKYKISAIDAGIEGIHNYKISTLDPEKEPNNHSNDNNNNLPDDGDITFKENWFSRRIELIETAVEGVIAKHTVRIRYFIYFIMLALYFAYFGYSMHYRFGDEGSKILLVITICLVWKLMFIFLENRGISVGPPESWYKYANSDQGKRVRRVVRYLAYIVSAAAMVTYLAVDVFPNNSTNLQSFFGMMVMILFTFIFSSKPSRVNWHPVFWSLVIQFCIAFLTLRTKAGYDSFKWLGDLVQTLFHFSDYGSEFVVGKEFRTWGLALSTSGVIIFTNAFIFLMNQWGVIEFIVLKLGRFLAFCLDTGPVESVVAAANIFIGLAEAPLTVRPYLPTVTKSELHTIMTCGFASISGGIMGLFIRLGAPANHLLTAAVISAPAALAFSKLMYPEQERVLLDSQKNIRVSDKKESNSLNAFSEGAVMAVGICGAVWSNMLAFVSILKLMDALTGWLGERAGVEDLTFGLICSYVLFPLAYVMGVDVSDCRKVGELIGVKLFATPVVGYMQLGDLIDNRHVLEEYISSSNNHTWSWVGDDIVLEASNSTLMGGVLKERTEVIATYAMCGFSAFTAIGICLGALIPLSPSRKQDIVNLIMRAFIAGNMASFATGAIAGVLYTSTDF